MAQSSVESDFVFESYKVDSFILRMKPSLDLLRLKGMLDPTLWDMKIKFRIPQFFKKLSLYTGGVELGMFLYNKGARDEEKVPDNALILVEATIMGTFKVRNDRFDKKTEEQLVKTNIPAILLPYLRAMITSAFATAGFGSVQIPLVNVHELAKQHLAGHEILEVD